MAISASMVKELREKTGAGMMDCKKALEECEGSIEGAVDWLRQKGLSKAAKKAGRATSEGLIASSMSADGKTATLVEVKCETDFVARNENFIELTKKIAKMADEANGINDTIQTLITDSIATVGENMGVGRYVKFALEGEGVLGNYIHSNGKIAVLVAMNCESAAGAANAAFVECAKNVAMQIAAANPAAVCAAELDPALLDREREVYRQKAREDGKPEQIIEKIVEGAVKKFYKEACLLEQPYIRDDKQTIQDLLNATGKALGEKVSVARFVRLQLGEDNAAEA